MGTTHFSTSNAIAIFWQYILIICWWVPNSFFLFYKQLDVVYVHEEINIFSWYGKCVASQYTSEVFCGVLSLLLEIVKETTQLPGRCLPGFSLLLKFFLLLSFTLFSFSWLPWWVLWLCWISCTFSDYLLSRIAGLYHWPFCCQSTPWLHFSASLCTPWGCADLCPVYYLFRLLPGGILSIFCTQSAAYKRLIYILPNLCGEDFSHL